MTWPSSDQPFPTPDSDQPPSNPLSPLSADPPLSDTKPNGSHAPDDQPIDSAPDDLSSILADSVEALQPDPFLGEQIPAPPIDTSSADSVTPARPRTSEVFRAVLPNVAGPFADAAIDEREHSSNGNGNGYDATALQITDHPGRSKSDEDNEPGDTTASDEYDHPHTPWSQLFLLSYASAVTLALTWILWTGRTVRPVPSSDRDQPPTASNLVDDDLTRPTDLPLPPSNLTALGTPIRLGDLEVTPIAVTWQPVQLVRSFEPSEVRTQDHESLVLRLTFKNLSKNNPLAPFDREFVREQSSHLDESYIELPDGKRVGLFPLALDSEWTIRGQDFSPIDPGQSLTTIVVSAPTPLSRLLENQTWRLRVRTDTYKTDVLGVRFSKREVSTKPPPED